MVATGRTGDRAGAQDLGGDDRAADISLAYRFLADGEYAGYCPFYEHLAREAADDAPLLALLADLDAPAKRVPVLLNAAVHDLVLARPELPLAAHFVGDADGDPYPVWRAAVVEHLDHLSALVATRSIQTNEVGRAAALVPAIETVRRQSGRSLAVVELGTSAGLNLLLPRFAVTYRSAAGDLPVVGDAASPVQLQCELRGPLVPPLPTGVIELDSAVGIDRAPVDVDDTEARRWLQACLWPQVPDRAARLRAALDLARRHRPTVRRGDALAALPDALDEVADDGIAVVVATWVLAYLSRPDRVRLGALLDEHGRRRPLAAITAEYPGVAPWVPEPARPPALDDDRGATLLGVATWSGDGSPADARAAAWMQAHGSWLDWLDDRWAS